MVMLRGNTVDDPTTPKKPPELDSSSEFLSLQTVQRRNLRRRGAADDSCSSVENNLKRPEDSPPKRNLRTRELREKHRVSFANVNGTPKKHMRADEDCGKHFLRPRLRTEDKFSTNKKTGDVCMTPTKRKRRAEEEYGPLRRSSRITRYKQSVLYDQLITNTAEALLQKMDDMHKKRFRLRNRTSKETNRGHYSGTKRKNCELSEEETTNDCNASEFSEVGDEEEDEDEEDEEDEEEEEIGKRYEFRQRKSVQRYQAPMKEPRKKNVFYNRSSVSRRSTYQFNSGQLYNKKRKNRRKHAFYSSDSTSSASSDDEEEYKKRRQIGSQTSSTNACLPLNLRKEDLLGIHKDRMKVGASLADVDPMQIDQTVRFDSIGGLLSHISALKEMIVFPLLYPEVFERFKIQPPRGCLFYGPPGTGKTLVARALANECSQGNRKAAFFMRKGADCLSKWVGESERQLRLLFDQAYQMRPSIIFFDEIDGLAPVRSSRQDQIHSSIVSTLLALMDGLDNRGEVVVIGATNRLDSIDPALRRPGRFDREFHFSLPDRRARKEIFRIHTREWNPKLSDDFIEELAEKCVGYCGADIKAVCSEAALCALRRRYPQIYSSSQKLQLDVASICINSRDFLTAMKKMVPASQRVVSSPAKALAAVVQPLLSTTLDNVLHTLKALFPHAEQGLLKKGEKGVLDHILEDDLIYGQDNNESLSITRPKEKSAKEKGFLHFNMSPLHQPTSYRPRLLLEGHAGSGQSTHLAPAVLHTLEKFTTYTLDVAVLFGASSVSPEEACTQVFCEAKRTSPSILYIPNIPQWWDTVSLALRAAFLSLLQDIPSFSPVLLLATSEEPYTSLVPEVKALFCKEYKEVFSVPRPSAEEREKFFEDVIVNQAAKPPVCKKQAVMLAMEVLPLAPPPPPRQLTELEQRRLEEQEEDTLRELRLFLRNITNRLAQDKRFKAFTRPVDVEEVPDYTSVIKQPMDLSTVLSNIDMHKYVTVKDYMHDVDLIWKNALEYNPNTDPSARQIRHRACELKDTAHAIIRDELQEEFEKLCEQIKESRIQRGCSMSKFAPPFYHVLSKKAAASDMKKNDAGSSRNVKFSGPVAVSTPRSTTCQRRKRRRRLWSSGIISKKTYSSKEEDEEAEDNGNVGESMESEDSNEEAVPRLTEYPECALNGHLAKEKLQCGDQQDCLDQEIKKARIGVSPEAVNGAAPQVEEITIAEKGVNRMTRGKKQQIQQPINDCNNIKAVSEETPVLVVDHKKLKSLLQEAVSKTKGFGVHQLEKLYASLCQCIYRHRRDYDKTALIQAMKKELDCCS